MEEGVVPQGAWIGFEIAASVLDEVLNVGQGLEVPVDKGLVNEAPEVLCGLEFRRVGR
ncbi:hypothetical protein SAMN04488125_1486 [Methylorubrum salsuginis]|uniref:Uncharacterized protein n=1 Tax=Methylorubrum salsuginis TaxID=414703 RepID=A0A1I4MYJ9_9HYPH|nr:hypothetical protein SAMN04488125_1486 [Methylorubrum salsuginis]